MPVPVPVRRAGRGHKHSLAGIGIGLVTARITTAALGRDESAAYGATAAVFNTFRTTGLTLGVAIMGAILASFGPAAAFAGDFDRQHHEAFVDGFSTAVVVNAVIAFAAAGLAAYSLRAPAPTSFARSSSGGTREDR